MKPIVKYVIPDDNIIVKISEFKVCIVNVERGRFEIGSYKKAFHA